MGIFNIYISSQRGRLHFGRERSISNYSISAATETVFRGYNLGDLPFACLFLFQDGVGTTKALSAFTGMLGIRILPPYNVSHLFNLCKF